MSTSLDSSLCGSMYNDARTIMQALRSDEVGAQKVDVPLLETLYPFMTGGDLIFLVNSVHFRDKSLGLGQSVARYAVDRHRSAISRGDSEEMFIFFNVIASFPPPNSLY